MPKEVPLHVEEIFENF